MWAQDECPPTGELLTGSGRRRDLQSVPYQWLASASGRVLATPCNFRVPQVTATRSRGSHPRGSTARARPHIPENPVLPRPESGSSPPLCRRRAEAPVSEPHEPGTGTAHCRHIRVHLLPGSRQRGHVETAAAQGKERTPPGPSPEQPQPYHTATEATKGRHHQCTWPEPSTRSRSLGSGRQGPLTEPVPLMDGEEKP